MLVKMKNINYGKRNPLVRLHIGGNPERAKTDIDGGFPPSVHVHFNFGLLTGGFATDIGCAETLREALDQAIKTAKSREAGQ